jgi:hypothetical protein
MVYFLQKLGMSQIGRHNEYKTVYPSEGLLVYCDVIWAILDELRKSISYKAHPNWGLQVRSLVGPQFFPPIF